MSEFDGLREAASQATPGRWKLWGMSVMADQDGTSNVDTAVHVASTHYRDENGKPRTWDADWIFLTQPGEVLALLDRLEAAEAERDDLRDLMQRQNLMIATTEIRAEGAEVALARVRALLDDWEAAHTHLGIERGNWGPSSSSLHRALEGVQEAQNRDLTASEVESDPECHRDDEGRSGARDGSGL